MHNHHRPYSGSYQPTAQLISFVGLAFLRSIPARDVYDSDTCDSVLYT